MKPMHPLGALINSRRTHEGWSFADVERRAEELGFKLGKSNVHRLETGPPDSLTKSVIYALAAVLGVTPLSIANAALASMGINPLATEVTDTLSTVEIDPTLTEADKRKLRVLVLEMRSQVSGTVAPRPRTTFSDVGWDKPQDPSGGNWVPSQG